MKIENNMTMKMKLSPELSCLEAQEKFWRGRFKEFNEKFADERKKMETLIIQITAENERLKTDLKKHSTDVSKCSISVQTSPMNNENNPICEYCQRPLVKTRTIFSKNRSTSYESNKEENSKSEFFIDNDLILRENTPVVDHHYHENNKIDVQRTIEKLFSSNSLKITCKLVELYEKRSKSVPDLVYEETDYDDLLEAENNFIAQVDSSNHSQDKVFDENDVILNDFEKNTILHEIDHQHVGTRKHSRNRRRFLPTVQNIRKKVLKNFSKIKKTCTNIKMTASNNDVTSSDVSNPDDLEHLTKNEERQEQIQTSPKCQLISAMKKSKSTGNIAKKVAFSDDLPTTKTVSESILIQMNEYRFRRQSDVKPLLIGSVQVHRDKFARPVPAPRSKKNIVVIHP